MTLVTDKSKSIKNRLELIKYCRDTIYSRVTGIRFLDATTVANLINYEFVDINCTTAELQMLEDSSIEEESLDRMLHYKIITGEGDPQID